MPGPRRPTGGIRFALELDGTPAGLPEAAAGGDAVAEVVVAPPGPDGIRRKHLGPVGYTDIVLTCGIGMEKPLWSWLADTLAGTATPRNGALRILDLDGRERERATFTHALVTEIGLPALDAASRDAFRLTVRITAEQVQRQQGKGAPVTAGVKGKQALVSDFSVSLDGLDLDGVARVGALSVRRPIAQDAVGETRDVEVTPGPVEVPNLELALAETRSESIAAWHRRFVIEGNNGDGEEKSGSISLLDPARKDALLRLDLKGVGIFALERAPAAGGDAIARLEARMYCEEMRLVPGSQVG